MVYGVRSIVPESTRWPTKRQTAVDAKGWNNEFVGRALFRMVNCQVLLLVLHVVKNRMVQSDICWIGFNNHIPSDITYYFEVSMFGL